MTRWILPVLLATAGPALAEESAKAPVYRGMTISCPTYGQIWGTTHMNDAIRQVRALGVEWVAIHPYAGIGRDGSVPHRSARLVGYLERAAQIARGEGVKLFWTPHLAHWGTFEWRGAIDFGDNEPAWQRFFLEYERFIVDQAKLAQASGAGLFSVGSEYERTVHREIDWRRIIRSVRKVYAGPITYAANWDGVHLVPFWDAVDLISVQAYFPLAAPGTIPTRSDVERAWARHLEALKALSEKHGGKRILFAEIGYSRGLAAASRPWEPMVDDSPRAIALRRMLFDVAFEQIERAPFVAGAFWWKWMPGRVLGHDHDFSMRDPEAKEALARHWRRARPKP